MEIMGWMDRHLWSRGKHFLFNFNFENLVKKKEKKKEKDVVNKCEAVLQVLSYSHLHTLPLCMPPFVLKVSTGIECK